MAEITANKPIGIFDSGVGGLTVASAIKQALPNEKIIYYGDTAHLPYGDKSKETIIHYSERITEFLLEQSCKVIVIACNTASANAFNEVKNIALNKAIVINVIDPVVEFINQGPEYKRIGVIGTKSTINSGSYTSKILAGKPSVNVATLATPLFVPMIEEGFIYDDISNAIIRNYLSRKELDNIEALILGCTHYPIIKNQIKKYFNFEVEVLDSASIVAYSLRDLLTAENLHTQLTKPEYKFLVSDYTDYFRHISKTFFEEDIDLRKNNIWN